MLSLFSADITRSSSNNILSGLPAASFPLGCGGVMRWMYSSEGLTSSITPLRKYRSFDLATAVVTLRIASHHHRRPSRRRRALCLSQGVSNSSSHGSRSINKPMKQPSPREIVLNSIIC